jgi:formylglycine-generating enzyme
MIRQQFSLCVRVLVILALMGHLSFAFTSLDFVTVGDPGNPAIPLAKAGDESMGYGVVDYVYRMGKFETTNLQYASFLNAVAASDPNSLYDPGMGMNSWGGISRSGVSGSYTYSVLPNMANKPVNFVSGYDVGRFANWLHNGQPTGEQDSSTTEAGAYTFSGPETMSARNAEARYFIPTEHEWDKAAFYEEGANTWAGSGWHYYTSGIHTFPTKATVDEFGNVTNPSQKTVNFQLAANWNGSTRGNVTTVGSAGSVTNYGAYDMSGNVFEWTVADPTKPDPNEWGPFTVRGGSFTNQGHVFLTERNMVHHDNHNVVRQDVGFRLAAAYFDPSEYNVADFNEDTFVNGADLLLWTTQFGDLPAGDTDDDGDSDGNDFLVWQRNLAANNESLSVPEPASWLLSSAALGLLHMRRRIARCSVARL